MTEIDNPITKQEVLEAIKSGKAGRAPGFSGYTKEFYRHFAPDLIDFILKYIWYTEEQGILSTNQRMGIITLLPKGDKDKKSLKNWRPITLLSTLEGVRHPKIQVLTGGSGVARLWGQAKSIV